MSRAASEPNKKPRKESNERQATPTRPEALLRHFCYVRIEAQDRYVKRCFSDYPISDENTARRKRVFEIVDAVPFDPDGVFVHHGLTLGELSTQMSLNITGLCREDFRNQVIKKPRWTLEEDAKGAVALKQEEA